MGRFTKRLVVGLAGALALAGGAFADAVLDDFEKGGNENKFGAYWYFYTNLTACAKSNNPSGCDKKTFTNYVTDAKVEIIENAEKDGSQLKFKGAYDSKLADPHGGKYSGVMKFSNLMEPWSSDTNGNSWEDVYPGVGMGTQLTTDSLNGIGADFKSAKAISFWLKVSTGIKQVNFKVETAAMLPSKHTDWKDGECVVKEGKLTKDCGVKKDCPADAAYMYEIKGADLSTNWTKVTVPLTTGKSGLDRETWEITYKPFTFKLEEVTKIAWSVDGKTAGVTEGWIAVDDIVIEGFDFDDKWACPTCVKADVAAAPPEGAKLITDFDNMAVEGNVSVTQNLFGEYWYAYTDIEGRKGNGNPSTITNGQWNDPNYDEGLSLEVKDMGYGYGGTDGVLIEFTMGEPYGDGTAENNMVQPFVGLGTNLAPEGEYYDGTQLGSIWFRYRTSGFDELYVEVHDEYAVTHDDAEVFFIKIPGTAGAWKTAEIPLSVLRLPSWAKNRTGANATLNKAKLAKIQLKNQSPQDGSIQIDDFYMLDPSIVTNPPPKPPVDPNAIKYVGAKGSALGLRAVYNRGSVGVHWNAATSVASGNIQLVNTKGRIVASAPIAASAGKVTASLSAGTLPTGMYFVRVNAKGVNGKKIVQQTPISIVK
jgi:hypothetical protein